MTAALAQHAHLHLTTAWFVFLGGLTSGLIVGMLIVHRK